MYRICYIICIYVGTLALTLLATKTYSELEKKEGNDWIKILYWLICCSVSFSLIIFMSYSLIDFFEKGSSRPLYFTLVWIIICLIYVFRTWCKRENVRSIDDFKKQTQEDFRNLPKRRIQKPK